MKRNYRLFDISMLRTRWSWILVFLVTTGCRPQAEVPYDYKFVSSVKANDVRVHIVLRDEILTLTPASASEKFMEAVVMKHQPYRGAELKYLEEKDRGVLLFRTASVMTIGQYPRDDQPNLWKMVLRQGTPLQLKCETSRGDARLHLDGLPLKRLELDTGQGKTWVDLSQVTEDRLYVRVTGETGKLYLEMSPQANIRIVDKRAEGSLKADGFEKKEVEYTYHPSKTSTQEHVVEVIDGSGPIVISVSTKVNE